MINESNYSDEYKTKLLEVLHGEMILTDELKTALDTEVMDTFDDHCFEYGCSSSNPSVYFYGPWETIPGDEYEEWKKLNKL